MEFFVNKDYVQFFDVLPEDEILPLAEAAALWGVSPPEALKKLVGKVEIIARLFDVQYQDYVCLGYDENGPDLVPPEFPGPISLGMAFCPIGTDRVRKILQKGSASRFRLYHYLEGVYTNSCGLKEVARGYAYGDGETKPITLTIDDLLVMRKAFEGLEVPLTPETLIPETPAPEALTRDLSHEKRSNNLHKIIGALVLIKYQKATYWNGDKINATAVATAIATGLSELGYTNEGFKDRHLRQVITDAIELISQNKA